MAGTRSSSCARSCRAASSRRRMARAR
jgi:hypothetical protein